ncbi:unnamed protein product [Discosporangium mesarthrocarpum]
MLAEAADLKDAEGTGAGGAVKEKEVPKVSMATQITSFNPCKNDPYGASSMPIYQVTFMRACLPVNFCGTTWSQRLSGISMLRSGTGHFTLDGV